MSTANLSKPFQTTYPLKKKTVRNLSIITLIVGELEIEGVGYLDPSVSALSVDEDRYKVDIDYIRFNGTDIKAVLDVMDVLEEIEEACVRAFALQCESEKEVACA